MTARWVNLMAIAQRGFVSLNCVDAKPPAEFGTAMLGSEIMFTTAAATVGVRTDWVWLSCTRSAPEGGHA